MTAQILVVDDVPANIKVLEAKLASEYYGVITASDGYEALEQAKKYKPDIILLDVMMPGMDGFEACKKIKEDSEISHIPVVMVTALSDQSDRVRGLEAGADDFITKPINDIALFARVRSLVRIKMLLDELRLRDKTRAQLGVADDAAKSFTSDVTGARILLIDDDELQAKQITSKFEETYEVEWLSKVEDAIKSATEKEYDVIIISTTLMEEDGLRIATNMKSVEDLRHVPIVTLVDEDDDVIMAKTLELGMNDYLRLPVDKNEMQARIRTQIRRKKYQEALRKTYQDSVSMAITDGLTGLYNRHYLNAHLSNMVEQAATNRKALSLMLLDMDHFKTVNDTYGHDAGDAVLKQLAQLLLDASRSTDLVARFGGEEFVIVMPETAIEYAKDVAERVRENIEESALVVNHADSPLKKTVSIGVSDLKLNNPGDNAELLTKRADEALYKAKNNGRNQVVLG